MVKHIKSFIISYGQDNALPLPGRIPGYREENIQLISTSDSKKNVWKTHTNLCESNEERTVSYSHIFELWEQFGTVDCHCKAIKQLMLDMSTAVPGCRDQGQCVRCRERASPHAVLGVFKKENITRISVKRQSNSAQLTLYLGKKQCHAHLTVLFTTLGIMHSSYI